MGLKCLAQVTLQNIGYSAALVLAAPIFMMAALARHRTILCIALIAWSPAASAAASKSKIVIAHVQCAVCKMACKEVRQYAKNKSIEEEDHLADLVENMCNPKMKEGKWLAKLDITQGTESSLVIQRQEKVGECREECRAVQQACSKAIVGKDDVIVSLLQGAEGLAKFHNKICDKPCKQKSLPKLDKWTDEEFKEDK